MKLLLILLPFLILDTSLAYGASLQNKIPELMKNNPTIIIVGEDHNNSGLASGINGLLKTIRVSNNFNCLFLELPSDIQPALNEAIKKNDIKEFSLSVYDSKIPATLQAFQKMGFSKEQLEQTETFLQSNRSLPLDKYPFDKETLELLSSENIVLIADDEASNGANTLGNTYYSLLDNYYPRDPKRDIESSRLANIRSTIMSKNIDEKFKQMKCEKALVVVGYAHLYTNQFYNGIYNSDLVLSPIQDQLTQKGYEVSVLVAEQANVKEADLSLMPDSQNRFSRFLGFLLTP